MEFCPDCRNLLFLKITKKEGGDVELVHKCGNCNYKNTAQNTNNSCIYTNPYNIDRLKYYIRRKDFLKYDPTIPHIDIMPCPNKSCSSNTGEHKNDALFMCIDNIKLLNLYVCMNCNVHWTNK